MKREQHNGLFQAAASDDTARIVELIKAGVDPNCVDPSVGHTPLYSACVTNSLRAIKTLLQHRADPNKRFTYRSPIDDRIEADVVAIMYVASGEAVSALIEAGADVNFADAAGTTALMRAAFRGQPDVVRLLLVAGASPRARQAKRRGCEPCTACELAESKIEFWKEHRAEGDKGRIVVLLQKLEEVRSLLCDAERGVAAPRDIRNVVKRE